MEREAVSELQFSVLVTRPGFYHLKNFQFRAKQMVRITQILQLSKDIFKDICDKKCFDQSTEKFLPMDISFSVKQK